MSKTRSVIFYVLVIFSVLVSLYDVYCTVLTVDTIHLDEMNPIAKKIILFGNESRTCQGVAYLVWIKTLLLCLISSGTTIFHYSKRNRLNNFLFAVCVAYFVQNVLLLGVLLS